MLLESLTLVHVCLCATSLLWVLHKYEKSGFKESLSDFNLRNAGGTLHIHEPGQIWCILIIREIAAFARQLDIWNLQANTKACAPMVLIKDGIRKQVKPDLSSEATESNQRYNDANPEEINELQKLAGLKNNNARISPANTKKIDVQKSSSSKSPLKKTSVKIPQKQGLQLRSSQGSSDVDFQYSSQLSSSTQAG